MITRNQILQLTSLPVIGVAEHLGLQVRRKHCLCPFHDDAHPSLTFNTMTNRYRCYVCGAFGGTIDLVMGVRNYPFREACRWLAERSDMILEEKPSATEQTTKKIADIASYERFFKHPQLTPVACHFLFEERRLSKKVIEWCHINSFRDKQGINWLQIPYYNTEGKLTGVQNRNLDFGRHTHNSQTSARNDKDLMPRFRFPYGSVCTIYNLPILASLGNDEPLFITEGCSDCWSILSSGHKAIAIPSATLLKVDDLDFLDAMRAKGWKGSLHMFPDNDAPGDQLFQRITLTVNRYGMTVTRHDLPDDCKDFSDFYVKCKP